MMKSAHTAIHSHHRQRSPNPLIRGALSVLSSNDHMIELLMAWAEPGSTESWASWTPAIYGAEQRCWGFELSQTEDEPWQFHDSLVYVLYLKLKVEAGWNLYSSYVRRGSFFNVESYLSELADFGWQVSKIAIFVHFCKIEFTIW